MFSAEQLLQPISPDQPAGADLSFSPELDAIAHARTFDDPSLDQGEWVTDLKEADWEFVVRSCAGLLEKSSKDLRLAGWLTEAAAKQYRLRGLAEGLRVMAGLLERFWDQGLYPEAEDGDQERRIGTLGWLLGRIKPLVREMPLTDGNGGGWSAVDFESARRQGGDERRIAELDAAKRATSPAFRRAFAADAQACVEALLELERVADQRLGNDAPGFVGARDALRDIQSLVPAPVEEAAPEAVDSGIVIGGGEQAMAAPAQSGPPGAIHTRQQAIAQLRAIADFFRRTEPHSPVSYYAEKAAKAGEQDLHTWLRSVVKDSASLAHIEELLGVQPGSE
ncbi:type VI secretion system protein TssA [Pseudoduganella sp. SL102]|uniref:type VI secretion system protein TssA n=1 Tax=Pseudoduganella sp. SL102 TaxID=2995154 RepID=UPI00248D390C|nr:type VI secretion system protein TssA [Pseudoduganella sp. SL102]WBS04812.1 type VI secretion system protein TssA [Pseudoduganella sp. SL102]